LFHCYQETFKLISLKTVNKSFSISRELQPTTSARGGCVADAASFRRSLQKNLGGGANLLWELFWQSSKSLEAGWCLEIFLFFHKNNAFSGLNSALK